LTRTIASRLGPAKPRGIGCEGAGASVIASQSRQENFSRTRSMIFQRRGSHSRVFETTSPSLCSRALPHLPHAQGAGSTIRSTARLSGSGRRGGRGCCARFSGAVCGAVFFGFLFGLCHFEIFYGKLELLDQQLAAFGGLPELLAPCLGQHQLQPLDFQPADGDFALRQCQLLALRKDHRMRGGKVGGKRIGGRRHDDEPTIFATKNRAGFPL
jgi:hypothetical protein